MERRALWLSLALHGGILALMFADLSFMRSYEKPVSAPIMIDLSKVKISSKTNLPQKTVTAKKKNTPKVENKQPEVPPKKEVAVQQKPIPKPDISKKEQPPVLPKNKETPKDAVPVPPPKKEVPKTENTPPKKAEQKKYDLNSLLATVEKVRQAPTTTTKEPVEDKTEGMSGRTEGRLDQLMTISDKDLISSKLRECWYIDGGAQDLEEILVELKAVINKDGSVRDVQIMNKMHYPAFESVAESARRAVHICSMKGEESPFKILSNQYADHYNDWHEIRLRFSPTKGIF